MESGEGDIPVPIKHKRRDFQEILSPLRVSPHLSKKASIRSGGRSRFRREALSAGGRKHAHRTWREGRIDEIATIFHAWKSGRNTPAPSDLREPVFSSPQVRLVIFLLDISDSMAETRKLARLWIVKFLGEAYFRRDPVAIVAVQGTSAEILIRPTTSLHFVLHRLASLEEKGATPLGQGIRMAERLMRQWRERYHVIDLYVISDGRSTEPLTGEEMERCFLTIKKFVRKTLVVNPVKQAAPFARELAALMDATYLEPKEFLEHYDLATKK